MTHNLLKAVSVPVIAILIVMFAITHPSTANLLSLPNLTTGTYWNLDAGFGDSELRLLDGGQYTNGGIGVVSVAGRYTITQNQIVFNEYGPADAPCLHIPGTYKWRLNRKVLTLEEVEDKCPTRRFDWGSGLWLEQHGLP